jgi:ribosomal protein S18 acetylase RimI-like enzyme
MVPPGACRDATLSQSISVILGTLRYGPAALVRLAQWTEVCTERDPLQPHWHLGPIAVEPAFQGTGIGSRLMEACCAQMDQERTMAYLETDKAENVHFYRKFGFRTVGEIDILGRTNWFMSREPVRPGSFRARSG